MFSARQYDLVASLFFNIWPFAAMRICPIASKLCQSKLRISLNISINAQKIAKEF